jgi:hypothetical protein
VAPDLNSGPRACKAGILLLEVVKPAHYILSKPALYFVLNETMA